MDISQKTYSNIESNRSKPTLPQLSKLSDFLDFDLLELLQEQGIVFNQRKNKIKNNGIIHNNIADNIINQYNERLKDKNVIIQQKEEIIVLLKDKIRQLETK